MTATDRIPPTWENIRAALSSVSPDLARDEWVKVGMAVKDGLGDDGFLLFDEWSQGGQTYNSADIKDAWKSFKSNGKTTIATLWRTALDRGWKPDSAAYQETEAERQEREQKRKAKEAIDRANAEKKAKQAATKAMKLWKAGIVPTPDFPYLHRKGVQPVDTLREITAEKAAEILGYAPKSDGKPLTGRALVVPVKIDGKLTTAELIDQEGRKAAIAGGLKSGGFWAAQPMPKGDGAGLVLAIGEGVATCLSVRESAGYPVFAALMASALPKVTRALRERYPAALVLVLGDVGNGLKHAEQAGKIRGAALAVPSFTPELIKVFQHQHSKPPTDFNDLHQIAGPEAVRDQLTAALLVLESKASSTDAPTTAQDALEPPTSTSPLPSPTHGNVIDFADENALRLAFEQRIEAANDDFQQLVYVLSPEIQATALRRATCDRLLKIIGAKANISLDALRELAPAGGAVNPKGLGRSNGAHLPYEVVDNQIFVFDEMGKRPLCNFVAWIAEEVIHDNGLEEECLFRIEGRLHDGSPLPTIEVPSSKFAALGWVTGLWGARPFVHAGNTIRDHLRTAIQALFRDFRRRTVYGHTGWRKFGEEWAFLHAGGAIFADGRDTRIEVKPGEGHMRRYAFRRDAGDLAADVRASLRLLDLSASNPALGLVLLASVYRAPLAEALPADHGIYLAASTGSRKSEAAAMCMAHFGREFERQRLPANWDDSESDIEAKAHAAKDCVFVVDDFKPRGAASDVHKLHVKADRLFRAVGNQSGRGRRTPDMKQRPAFYPRGLVLATGEDIPRGASLRARMLSIELSPTDIDNAVLSELQESAHTGALERAMRGYLSWLASQMDTVKADLPGFLRTLRERANREGFANSHPRAADIFGSLSIGLGYFLDFAVDAGAADNAVRVAYLERGESLLKGVIAAQGEYQGDQDEVTQFIRLLRSCLNMGHCHVSDIVTQGPPPEHPHSWGWRIIPATDENPAIEKPQGEKVGWVDSEEQRAYLDGTAAFKAVATLARATGENVAITERTLWKRMYDRGLLHRVTKEKSGKLRLEYKRTIAGVRQSAYVVSVKTLEDSII